MAQRLRTCNAVVRRHSNGGVSNISIGISTTTTTPGLPVELWDSILERVRFGHRADDFGSVAVAQPKNQGQTELMSVLEQRRRRASGARAGLWLGDTGAGGGSAAQAIESAV